MARILPIVLLVVIAVAAPAVDGPVSLLDIADELNLKLQWDPYGGTGFLQRNTRNLRFSLWTDFVVLDYSERIAADPPYLANGAVVLPASFRQLLLDYFPKREVVYERRIAAIFIDPGHGGKDPGAIGRHRVFEELIVLNEKDLVLDASLRLRDALTRRYPDKDILLSRDGDYYLTLEERTAGANRIEVERNESVVFVSVHANASLNPSARGFEVWFLPPEIRRRNLVVAEDLGVADPDVLSIINTIREEEITMESVLLARNILSGLQETVGFESPNRGLKEESWYVVRNAKMPSVLIELGFVTNPNEFVLLLDQDYLARVVEGIYNGVVAFIHDFEAVRGYE